MSCYATSSVRLELRYSSLRFRPTLQFGLFVLTAGCLAYFSENNLWAVFWPVFALVAIIQAGLWYMDSSSFRSDLQRLREQEFKLASSFEKVSAYDLYLMADSAGQLNRNDMTRRILEEGNRFSLATLTAASYIDPAVDRHWQVLKSRLDDGCTLRLLLQDPLCEEKKIRDRRNYPDGRQDGKLDIAAVVHLAALYPERVLVRFTAANMYCAVFFSENHLTFDPYHLGRVGSRIENRFITFAYQNPGRGLDATFNHYALLVSHFEYLWSELGVGLTDYLRSNLNELASIVSPNVRCEIEKYLDGTS
jgi:hypothetical protein